MSIRSNFLFLLVDKYEKLYNNKTAYYYIIEAKKELSAERRNISHSDNGRQLRPFHYLEKGGGEQFIILKVQIPKNNDVVISINENHNWIILKAPPRRDTAKDG